MRLNYGVVVGACVCLLSCGRSGELDASVSEVRSGVSVFPHGRVRADGESMFTVAVTVRDRAGRGLSGHTIELMVNGLDARFSQPELPTDEFGLSFGGVASGVGDDKSLIVTINPGPDQIILNDTPSLAFGVLSVAAGFDSDPGGSLPDLVGGLTGTLNGAQWTASGKVGGGLDFDGSSNVNLGYADSGFFRKNSDRHVLSVSAWIKPSSVGDWQVVYQIGGTVNGAVLGLTPSGAVRFALRSDTGEQPVVLDSSSAITAGQWAHIAATSGAAGASLFVNGVEVATAAGGFVWNTGNSGHSLGQPACGDSALQGPNSDGSGESFAGVLDELRVYEYCVTADQIAADMNP